MPSYLVETYLARGRAGERTSREGRARSVAETLKRIRFEHSIYVPEDEICFFVFEAPSSREAALAAELAGLDAVRIVEAAPPEREEP